MKKHLKRSLITGVTTFLISVLINFSSNAVLEFSPLAISLILLFFIVLLGIVFDIIGTAAASGEEAPFHAMATDKVAGAKHSIWLVRSADRVASFCNDVVGDIAGTISGAIGAAIVFRFALNYPGIRESIANTLLIGFVTAVTVGGKAYAKSFAINRSTDILQAAGRVLYALERVGLRIIETDKAKNRK
ncbi:MAG: hypothetical protein GX228_08090 [Firmicutes bacterium]|jgi:CBS domain containing-hemolysin-like protein|nr:hypothetical protein [Bacillota bacterium]NLL88871.1 hypothetical protein [Bacillota bacterium]HKM18361.1 hypothetical protein [Limnochordia bacterium]